MESVVNQVGGSGRSVAELAAAYGLGIATVWRHIRSGSLEAIKVGNRTIITDTAEREWLAKLPRAGARSAA